MITLVLLTTPEKGKSVVVQVTSAPMLVTMCGLVTRAEGHQVQVQISGESLPFQKHDGEQWMYTEVGDAKAHE